MTSTRLFILAAFAATLAATPACSLIKGQFYRQPGGNSRSDDTYTYVSTAYEPLTLTLYDTRDREPLWTVDVPIDQKVTVRFRANKIKEGTPRRPDIMEWAIFDATERWARLDSSMAVPPPESRMLRVSLRSGPEFPADPIDEQTFPDPDQQWDPVSPQRYRSPQPGE